MERPDVPPVEDGAVRQVFKWLYGAPITDNNVREVVCSLWKPCSSTSVRYMYRALNMGLLESKPLDTFFRLGTHCPMEHSHPLASLIRQSQS